MKKIETEHKKLIGEKRLQIIRQLFLDNPEGVVLTGSVSLILQNSIGREVEDLDFIIGTHIQRIKYKDLEFILTEEKYIKSNSSACDARVVEIEGVKCEFYYDKKSPIDFLFDNILIQIQDMKAIKEKKLAYIDFYSEKINFLSQKLTKHIRDIKGIDIELTRHNV